MDDIDRAQAQEEMARDIAIRAASAGAPVIPATGACHWSDALLPVGARFCDVDCRDGWQREQSAIARNRGRA